MLSKMPLAVGQVRVLMLATEEQLLTVYMASHNLVRVC